jgi:hypothetical protein
MAIRTMYQDRRIALLIDAFDIVLVDAGQAINPIYCSDLYGE